MPGIILRLTDATMDDRPWKEFRFGKPITGYHIARLLKPYGIYRRKFRTAYDDLKEAFTR